MSASSAERTAFAHDHEWPVVERARSSRDDERDGLRRDLAAGHVLHLEVDLVFAWREIVAERERHAEPRDADARARLINLLAQRTRAAFADLFAAARIVQREERALELHAHAKFSGA